MSELATRHLVSFGAVLLVAALLTPSIASGAGGTYEVVQCDPLNRGVAGVTFEDAPSYAVKRGCGDPRADHAIQIANTRFAHEGRSGRVRWSTQSPSLRIVGAELQAKLRRDRGHMPRLWIADDDDHELARVAAGKKHATRFRNYSWHSTGPRGEQFIADLRCEHRGGCKHSDVAKTWLRNVHLQVADYADPRLESVSGDLMAGGWLRRAHGIFAQAADTGSGLSAIALRVNGIPANGESGSCNTVQATAYARTFAACQSDLEMNSRVTTAKAPFHEGHNSVSICGIDFAGNRACVERTVDVDNVAPHVVFASHQQPNDPELIRAPIFDATSGVVGGRIYYRAVGGGVWRPLTTQQHADQLQARVDSTLDPPGQYEFMVRATDAAGNTTATTRRADGQPMILTFPLKSGVRLNAHLAGGAQRTTIGYGRRSKVSGFLRDASGEALADQNVTVTEHFGEGALIDTRVRTVQTDSQGRWKERLPSGPSRKVTASYAGTRRYLPDSTAAGSLRVKTKASLRLTRHHVPEGHGVAFKGRIGHLAARIPSVGKLVELEVKDGKSWQTVRQPFYTRPNGKFRLHYRFARFYVSDVRYRFRVRVIRERNWPYKAPVSSRVRKLVVKAR